MPIYNPTNQSIQSSSLYSHSMRDPN